MLLCLALLFLMVVLNCSATLEQYVLSEIPETWAGVDCRPYIVKNPLIEFGDNRVLERVIIKKKLLLPSRHSVDEDTLFLLREACRIGANLVIIYGKENATFFHAADSIVVTVAKSVEIKSLGEAVRYNDSLRVVDSLWDYVNPADTVIDYTVYSHMKNMYVLSTFHLDRFKSHGIAAGFCSEKNHLTNGIRLDLCPAGLFLYPSPGARYKSLSAKDYNKALCEIPRMNNVNGVNLSLSSGVLGEVNGFSFGGTVANVVRQRGLSIAIWNTAWDMRGCLIALSSSATTKMTGVQIGLYSNETQVLNGLQIGLVNFSRVTRGLQVGLWNVNEYRSLPFFNVGW